MFNDENFYCDQWQLRRNLEKRTLSQNKRFGVKFIVERRLYSWWKITQDNGDVVETFFGNDYDKDRQVYIWRNKALRGSTSYRLYKRRYRTKRKTGEYNFASIWTYPAHFSAERITSSNEPLPPCAIEAYNTQRCTVRI